jgi:N-acetylmuramoyl-L-alanine amidase
MKKKLFFLGLILAALASSLLSAQNIKTLNLALAINNEKISLESPLIQIGSEQYFPVRDALNLLTASLKYQRKDDNYLLTIKNNNITCLLVPNSKEIWINEAQHLLNNKPFFFTNRLYLPINDFFSLLGFKITKNKKQINITTTLRKRKKKSPVKINQKSDQLQLPYLEQDRAAFLAFSPKQHNLDNKFFYKNGILYVSLEKILKQEKFNINYDQEFIKISKQKKSYTFYKKSGDVVIRHKNYHSRRHLRYPLIFKNNSFYFPLVSFISALDYSFYWNSKDRSLSLLNKIQNIEIVETKNETSLIVNANDPLYPKKPQNIFWAKGYYVDLPYTKLESGEKRIFLNKYSLSMILGKSENNIHTRVFFFFHSPSTTSALKTKPYGAKCSFYSTITDIKEIYTGNSLKVKLESNGDIKYKISSAVTPPRYIIDIKNSICKLPQVLKSKYGPYKRIRCSQLKKDPPVTRIVFDYHKKITPSLSINKTASSLELTFPVTRYKAPPAWKNNKSIDNKVIFIDPGHGGRDPGALGPYRTYEKNYNIDISRRLKRKLVKDGAFVILARDKDQNPSLRKRAYLANKNKSDIVISVHINSFINSSARGTETYYYKYKDKLLAQCLQKEMIKNLRLRNNGVKRARLYILRNVKMPAALVEPLFITNSSDYHKLDQPQFREKIATSLYLGIKNYFSK